MANEQYDYLSEGDPMKVSGPTRNELLNVRSEAAALAVGNLIYVSGWSETYKLPLVTKADADASRRMATWICPEAIAQNANGTVAKAMRLIGTASANVDTSSTTVGDPIYLSATAGGWTKTDPAAAGAISQIIGRVAVVSATVGEIVFDMVAEGPTPKALGSSEIQDLSVTTAK
ncbi:MAG: hypothetical protein HY673_14235, partial [Chloroflexi bacterium]|nr:hypothetical protein [Chloroflexota bacterium]